MPRLVLATFFAATWLLVGLPPAHAQDNTPPPPVAADPAVGLKTLALAPVKTNPAILASAASAGSRQALDRMRQGLDNQLIAAVQQTRRVTVLARSDADSLIEENAASGQAFAYGKSDLTLVVTIDDFQDATQTATFATLGRTVTRRVVRFSAVAKLYETATNKLVETANFQEQNLESEELSPSLNGEGGELSDAMLLSLTRRMSEKIAQRVADVTFPARILAKTGKIVTLNRGEGSGIAVGQLWEVFAQGEELIDPDTGLSLGREELPVGQIRIRRLTPRTAQGEVVGEDLGIDRGAVVRRVTP